MLDLLSICKLAVTINNANAAAAFGIALNWRNTGLGRLPDESFVPGLTASELWDAYAQAGRPEEFLAYLATYLLNDALGLEAME